MRKLFLSWLKAVGISGTGRMRCAQWPWLQRTQICAPLLITHEYHGAIRAESLPIFAATGLMGRGRNLIRLLAQNRRLHALPAIEEQYETLRAEAERTIRAELESALPVSEQELQRIASALKARLGRDVELVCKINEKLIGGAAIRAGDLVIDGSVRARLEKLAATVGA